MKQLALCTSIHKFEEPREFAEELNLNENDLIITCRYIYEPFFGSLNPGAQVVYQEDYGTGEPDETMITRMYASITPDYERVIGIGGGTIMDISKLFCLKNMMPLQDLFTGKIPVEKKCPLVLVPTTCGTGSEVTNVAIVSFPSLDSKLRLAEDPMYAGEAVFIPKLLSQLPYHIFATSSIDALIHAIESSLSPLATPYSELFGHEAIRMIISAYQEIRQKGKDMLPDLMEKFLTASNYAGIAFGKAGCGAVHAMSYPLSGKYHVAHGEANYALLTAVLNAYSQKNCSEKYDIVVDILKEALHCEKECVFDELDHLLSFILEKKPLHAYGTTENDLYAFADNVLQYQQVIMSHNPAVLYRDDILSIYRSCL
ncbi:MAG: 4-hydroxybutyrate dehydrogenase [Eubacteriales bacterium]|nr:4-hydroxybutyrate dehydrogenase [Eubacteriales bacterium]